ncbi:hypothetical protein AALB_0051 [Agarivorans albus MKT 106]|uniref:Transmembrane protein n=1 Tax=Agarivorans albus MKT 106 TaxID=1331007 RepID=R9PPD6_AGAAL|nr:hypothetical protein AALB_0051 [Agarivorans albus MKT 106]
MVKSSKAIFLISTLISLLVCSGILYITWQHNPQCEFHCNNQINWLAWLPYGLISGALSFLLIVGLAFGANTLIKALVIAPYNKAIKRD